MAKVLRVVAVVAGAVAIAVPGLQALAPALISAGTASTIATIASVPATLSALGVQLMNEGNSHDPTERIRAGWRSSPLLRHGLDMPGDWRGRGFLPKGLCLAERSVSLCGNHDHDRARPVAESHGAHRHAGELGLARQHLRASRLPRWIRQVLRAIGRPLPHPRGFVRVE
jgi:hypothetical protein